MIHACIESSRVVQALRLNLQGSKTLFSIHSVLIGRNGCEELLLEKNIDDLVFFLPFEMETQEATSGSVVPRGSDSSAN